MRPCAARRTIATNGLLSTAVPNVSIANARVLGVPLVSAPDAQRSAAVARESAEHRARLDGALARLEAQAAVVAEIEALLLGTLRAGGKVLFAGNGGSAAAAQHFAAELVGRFKRERAPWAALSLTTDTSALTAIGNDYGYEEVFARQVRALGSAGDLLIVLTTSGGSENLLRAAAAARDRGLRIVAFCGERETPLRELTDVCLRAPSSDTAIVQELHLFVTHVLCELVEAELAGDGAS